MLFNSLSFLWFFPSVFILYWFVFNKSLWVQNAFVVVASYVFYGWWDWRFLSLIAFSTLVDYYVGQKIFASPNPKRKKYLLWLSLSVNLGILCFFKYFNFFANTWASSWQTFGIQVDPVVLNVLLPVGISFYTFQTMSYSIDVYKGNLKPTSDLIAFSAFVSFFPQLVAGPIERATNLLPQILARRTFEWEKAKSGISHVLYGMFKKVVIADNLAFFVNDIFGQEVNSSFLLILGAIAFGIQIYCDFSGYSDIAIGISKFLGFDLMTNFNFPYFSKNITVFWRRWHISLSTWFRDYIYIPLGGSKGGTAMKVRNTFVIFIVSGFWHGANWTFIIWGFIHAVLFIPTLLVKTKERAQSKFIEKTKNLTTGIVTFVVVTLAWIFFRANDVGQAFHYLENLFNFNFASNEILAFRIRATEGSIIEVLFILILFFVLDLWTQFRKYNFSILESSLILLGIIYLGNFFDPSSFIYFQF